MKTNSDVVNVVITHEQKDIAIGFLQRADTGEIGWWGAAMSREELADGLTENSPFGPRRLMLHEWYPTRPDGSLGYIICFIDGADAKAVVDSFKGQKIHEMLIAQCEAATTELERRNALLYDVLVEMTHDAR